MTARADLRRLVDLLAEQDGLVEQIAGLQQRLAGVTIDIAAIDVPTLLDELSIEQTSAVTKGISTKL